jgi:hypothetical protein
LNDKHFHPAFVHLQETAKLSEIVRKREVLQQTSFFGKTWRGAAAGQDSSQNNNDENGNNFNNNNNNNSACCSPGCCIFDWDTFLHL